MKWWRSRSLLLRVLGVQLLALALIWVTLSAYQIHQTQTTSDAAMYSDLVLAASALARVTSVATTAEQTRALAEHVRDLDVSQSTPPMRQEEFAYQIWKSDGTMLSRSQESPRLPDLAPGSLPTDRRVARDGWVLLAVRSPDQKTEAIVGHAQTFYVRVNQSLIWGVVNGYLQAAVLLTLLLWVTLRVGLTPLSKLARQVAARQRDDLTPLELRRPYREIEPLVAALNEKLGKIRTVMEREREFFADAAHELRTPLSVIAAQAHVVIAERDAAERAGAALALQNGIERSARVLNRLLLIGRLDATRDEVAMEAVDLAEIADDIVSDNRARARASGHSIAIAADSMIRCCSRENLSAALDCLIDNALKYTPAGTQIVVSVHADGVDSVLTVGDNGPGIPESLRERAFKRFERLGRSDQDGSGLGLAIVQRIAEMHGGVATLRAGIDGGCIFEMRMRLRAG